MAWASTEFMPCPVQITSDKPNHVITFETYCDVPNPVELRCEEESISTRIDHAIDVILTNLNMYFCEIVDPSCNFRLLKRRPVCAPKSNGNLAHVINNVIRSSQCKLHRRIVGSTQIIISRKKLSANTCPRSNGEDKTNETIMSGRQTDTNVMIFMTYGPVGLVFNMSDYANFMICARTGFDLPSGEPRPKIYNGCEINVVFRLQSWVVLCRSLSSDRPGTDREVNDSGIEWGTGCSDIYNTRTTADRQGPCLTKRRNGGNTHCVDYSRDHYGGKGAADYWEVETRVEILRNSSVHSYQKELVWLIFYCLVSPGSAWGVRAAVLACNAIFHTAEPP